MEEKEKILAAALAAIEKRHGKGSVMTLDQNKVVDVETVSSGSLSIDIALGIGGYPKGRIIEIYGPESSGKTTVALHAIAEIQKSGGKCAFIDVEHALDIGYAKRLGIDCGSIIISQPDTAEAALDITETLVKSGVVDAVIIDSVAALVPRAEIEGSMGDQLPGLQARLMSQALRKLTAIISRTNTLMIFINQIRMKIGVIFGSPEVTTGGNALKFFASVRLDVRKIGNIKEKEEIIGSKVKVKVVKNKMAPPFRVAEFDIIYGKGINTVGELVDIGVASSIIKKSGSWFSYGSERLGQGRENIIQLLNENDKLREEIKNQIVSSKPNLVFDEASNMEETPVLGQVM